MPTISPALRLNYRGDYDVGQVYWPNDVVAFEGSSYVAVAGSTGITPGTDSTYWGLVAAKGASPLTATTQTGAYTADAGDLVLADAAAAAFTVTLPAGPEANAIVAVRKVDASANAVTVVPSSGTIDGDAAVALAAQGAGATFLFDGVMWRVTATSTKNFGTYTDSPQRLLVPSYTPGTWYDRRTYTTAPNSLLVSASVWSSSNIHYHSCFVHRDLPIDGVAIATGSTGASPSSDVRVGTFAIQSSGAPGALLQDLGLLELNSSTNAVYQLTGFSAVLPKGWFYFGLSFNGYGTGNAMCVSNNVLPYPVQGVPAAEMTGAQSPTFGRSPMWYTQIVGTGGVAFTPGVPTGLTAVYPTASVQNAPNIWYRAA